MKYLVTYLLGDDIETFAGVFVSLDSAISFIKEQTLLPYTGDRFKIYSLNSPLTVRYLDNKIFID